MRLFVGQCFGGSWIFSSCLLLLPRNREIKGRKMNYICNLHDQSGMENKESSSHHAKKQLLLYIIMKCPKYHCEFWFWILNGLALYLQRKLQYTMLHDVHTIYPYPCPHSGSTSCSSDWSRKSAWDTHGESRGMLHRTMALGRGKNDGVMFNRAMCWAQPWGKEMQEACLLMPYWWWYRNPANQLIW